MINARAALCCIARVGERISLWIVITLITTSPLIYWGTLNALGPSSTYSEPHVEVDGVVRDEVYLGEPWQVVYRVRRHKINGNCYLPIDRFAEYVGGPLAGQRVLIDQTEIRFEGADDVFYPRWPPRPRPITRGLNASRREIPLLPDGVDEQVIDLYVVARYHCNPLDDFTAWLEGITRGLVKGRYIQGGSAPDRTPHARVTLKRSRP